MKTTFRATLACMFVTAFAAIAVPSILSMAMAQDANPAPAPNAPTNAVTNIVRDPFWPIGYTPRPRTTTVINRDGRVETIVGAPVPPPPPEDPPKWPDLRVTGTFGPTPVGYVANFAGIKGDFAVGQIVRKVEGKYEYSWKVVSIFASRKVTYTRLDFKKIK